MRKRFLGVAAAMVLAFSLAGCGSNKEASSGNTVKVDENVLIPEGTESAKLLDARENGLKVGYANDIPYEYIDDDGNFAGFEADIIKAVCAKIGITKVEPVFTSWDTYTTELQQGKFDIFGCGVYITDERMEVMNYCNMTYNLQDCIVVRKDSGIETIEDLKDKSVESTVGMAYMDVTQKAADDGLFGSAIEGGQPSSLALDVQTGKADAAMMDIVMGGYLTGLDNMSDLKVLDSWKNLTGESCSYLFNLDETDFVKEFNIGLDAIKEDGTLKKILDEYGLGSAMIGVEDGQVTNPER